MAIIIFNEIVNANGTPSIYTGITAQLPPPGTLGRWVLDTTTKILYVDNGTALIPILQNFGASPVTSVFGRAGAVTAQAGDYAAFYATIASLANYLPLAGGTLTGLLVANAAIQTNVVALKDSGFTVSHSAQTLTAGRIVSWRDLSGTGALLSDIPVVTGFVPYAGANNDVNLGNFDIVAAIGAFQDLYLTASGSTFSVVHQSLAVVGGNKPVVWRDLAGTGALLSDIPSVTGFVPYNGAAHDVDLVTTGKTLFAESVEAGHSATSGAGIWGAILYNFDPAGNGALLLQAGDAGLIAFAINDNTGSSTQYFSIEGHGKTVSLDTFTGTQFRVSAIGIPTVLAGAALGTTGSSVAVTTNGNSFKLTLVAGVGAGSGLLATITLGSSTPNGINPVFCAASSDSALLIQTDGIYIGSSAANKIELYDALGGSIVAGNTLIFNIVI